MNTYSLNDVQIIEAFETYKSIHLEIFKEESFCFLLPTDLSTIKGILNEIVRSYLNLLKFEQNPFVIDFVINQFTEYQYLYFENISKFSKYYTNKENTITIDLFVSSLLCSIFLWIYIYSKTSNYTQNFKEVITTELITNTHDYAYNVNRVRKRTIMIS